MLKLIEEGRARVTRARRGRGGEFIGGGGGVLTLTLVVREVCWFTCSRKPSSICSET